MQTSHPLPSDSSSLSVSTILSSMDQGAIFIDETGIVKLLNTNAQQLLNLTNIAFESPYSSLLAASGLTQDIDSFLADPSTRRSLSKRVKLSDEDEKSIAIILIKINHGLLILLRDQTELRELKMAASRSSRLKDLGEMAALVAHEIRNPLGGIKGFASLLHRDLFDKPSLQQMAQFVIDGTDNLNRLVTHILNYAHPFQTDYQTVEFVGFLKELTMNLQADAAFTSNIHLTIVCADAQIFVDIDPQLMRSALLNLSLNAIQAMPEGGTLSFDLKSESETLVLKIGDTGIGIKPENLKKLFRAFFTTKPEGNGFGLLEVNKVIQAHGGTIDVDSQLGKGTVFTLKIPIKGLKHVY